MVERTVGVEFDCETRTVNLIKEMQLAISEKEYAQKANAYLMIHYFAKKHRK
jgi:hypothetical protein